MKYVFLWYRLLYATVLLIFFANIARAVRFEGDRSSTEHLILLAAGVTSFALVILVLVFPKNWSVAFALASVIWVVLFTWFAWWSSSSPFRLHEVHSFETQQSAAEFHRHALIAGVMFTVLCAWFLSLILVGRYTNSSKSDISSNRQSRKPQRMPLRSGEHA